MGVVEVMHTLQVQQCASLLQILYVAEYEDAAIALVSAEGCRFGMAGLVLVG